MSQWLINYIKNNGWSSNFTFEGRYELIGVTFKIYDFVISSNRKTLDILDVGCSIGLANKSMKKCLGRFGIYTMTEGIDRAENVLHEARKNFDIFTCKDIMKITPKRKFDVIIAMNMIHFKNNNDLACLVEKCAEFLKPNGIMLTNDLEHLDDYRLLNKIKICITYLPKLKNGGITYYNIIKMKLEKDSYIKVRKVDGDKVLEYAQKIRSDYRDYNILKKFMHQSNYIGLKLGSLFNRKPSYKRKSKSHIVEIIGEYHRLKQIHLDDKINFKIKSR